MKKLATENKIWYFGALFLISLHFVVLANIQFTAWPEILLWPYLLLKGWLPYQNIAIAHTPLLLIELGVIYKLLGVGVWQLKAATWLTILFLDILVFYVAKRFWGIKAAVISLLFYVVFQVTYAGNGLWFDLCLALWGLAIYYFLKNKNYLLVGICWVLAFLTKQTAFWFLIPIALELIAKRGKHTKDYLRKFILGAFVTAFVFVVALFVFGIFDDFYNWAIRFGIFVLPSAKGQIKTPFFKETIYAFIPFLIIPIYYKVKKDWLLPVFAIAGVVGVYPRWELFHFQPALTFLALMFGLVLVRVSSIKKLSQILLVFIILFVFYSFGKTINYTWGVEDRFVDKTTMKVAEYVKENSTQEDKIYIVGYWDNIYALTDRLPAVDPWIPHLDWYLNYDNVEVEMLSDLSGDNPRLVIIPKGSGIIPKDFGNKFEEKYEEKMEIDGILIYKKL